MIPHVDDCLIVGVHAPPTRQPFERRPRRRSSLQQGPSNVIAVDETGQCRVVAALGGEVIGKKVVAVKFDAAVDKGRNAAKDEIAAECLAIEDAIVKSETRGGGKR